MRVINAIVLGIGLCLPAMAESATPTRQRRPSVINGRGGPAGRAAFLPMRARLCPTQIRKAGRVFVTGAWAAQ